MGELEKKVAEKDRHEKEEERLNQENLQGIEERRHRATLRVSIGSLVISLAALGISLRPSQDEKLKPQVDSLRDRVLVLEKIAAAKAQPSRLTLIGTPAPKSLPSKGASPNPGTPAGKTQPTPTRQKTQTPPP